MEFVKVYSVDNFDQYKEKLILAIEMTKENYDCKYAKMSASDYKVNYQDKSLYYDLMIEILEPYIRDYIHNWYCLDWKPENYWFAEYHDGSNFGWHTHEGNNVSLVLQVELDDERNATELLGLDLKLKEGDVVIFPSMMPHRGPVVTRGNKIILALNFNMFGSSLNEEEK